MPRGCPPAEPATNWDRFSEREPRVLMGRRGGTDEFLGREALASHSRRVVMGAVADPWISVWCSCALTPFVEARRRRDARNGQ